MKPIFKTLLRVAILILITSSLVGAFILIDSEPQTGPSDNKVIKETREHWQQLAVSEVKLLSVTVDKRDVMAADRVRFELFLVYQTGNDKTVHHERYSVIYHLFDKIWEEHRY